MDGRVGTPHPHPDSFAESSLFVHIYGSPNETKPKIVDAESLGPQPGDCNNACCGMYTYCFRKEYARQTFVLA